MDELMSVCPELLEVSDALSALLSSINFLNSDTFYSLVSLDLEPMPVYLL